MRSRGPFLVLSGLATLLRLPAFRRALAIRGLAVWILLRVVHVSVVRSTFGREASGGAELYLVEELVLLGLVGLAVHLDARRRGEDLFLANLGIPAAAVVAAALILPAILAAVLR